MSASLAWSSQFQWSTSVRQLPRERSHWMEAGGHHDVSDTVSLALSKHARERMAARRLPFAAVAAALNYGRIVHVRGLPSMPSGARKSNASIASELTR